ncbi:MAG: 2Fe-2S iron-sulfur cluster-binding protein [Candidatus Binatia bacterium]
MVFWITLAPFDHRFECDSEEPILAAALRNGFHLRHGCKQGGCGSCKTKVVSGEVEMVGGTSFALMDFEEEQGYALMCSSYPISDVTLDLGDYSAEELLEG